jgi:Protein of Unknown function (DUF2784)
MLQALNVFFFIVHGAWTLFNCVGWAWERTRRLHLAAVGLTAASWFGLGAVYGWGYCPCTDWHWQVRERLGYVDPPSYTQLLIQELTPFRPSTTLADAITLAVFLIAGGLSIALNARDRRRTRELEHS